MDRAFETVGRSRPVDPRLLERISAGVPRLAAVRPLPAPWILAVHLLSLAALAALAGAATLGFYGIHKLAAWQSAVIFPALAILIYLAAMASAASMVPAARQIVRPWVLVAVASAGLAALFALVFHDYSTAQFVKLGIPCLRAGLMNAVPSSLFVWLVVRRGFVLDSAAAGAAAGAVSGLAGVLMLELHCPLLEAPHAMVWHVAVIPLCALAGAAAGRFRR
jgi:hypothetical protein